MLRKMFRPVLIAGVAVLLFGSIATLSSAKGNHRPKSAKDIPALPTQVARGRGIQSAHVNLEPLPPDYKPGIDDKQAVQLALDQLGLETEPTSAQAFLGTNDQGLPEWIVTFGNVCGEPNLGPPGNGMPDCADNTLSVELDANTGAYLGAY